MILAVEITREKKNQFLNIPMESTVEYSEATAEMIDSEVRGIIGNQYTEKRWRF
jgi:ATP-dependent Zn protease